MADDKTVTEQDRANTTKLRGQVAAGISDPVEKRKFIYAQGEGKMSDAELKQDAYDQRNRNATNELSATPYKLAKQ